MAEIDYPPVQQALKRIRRLSADELAQHQAMMRERAVHTEITELRGAREEGRAEGLAEGLQQGLEAGLQQGLEAGLEQGLVAGQERGLLEGKRGMLISLLEQRFGPLTEQHLGLIRAAGLTALDGWSRRLVDATSIEDLLG